MVKNKQYKLIFNPYVARTLLVEYGHKIVDLKKDVKRNNSTIFVFEIDKDFFKDLERITNK